MGLKSSMECDGEGAGVVSLCSESGVRGLKVRGGMES